MSTPTIPGQPISNKRLKEISEVYADDHDVIGELLAEVTRQRNENAFDKDRAQIAEAMAAAYVAHFEKLELIDCEGWTGCPPDCAGEHHDQLREALVEIEHLNHQLDAQRTLRNGAEAMYGVTKRLSERRRTERDGLRADLAEMTRCRDAALRYADRQHVPIELDEEIDVDGEVLSDRITDH